MLIQYPAGKKDTSYIIPDSVTNIDAAFCYCTNLTTVTIPDSVTSIDTAFFGCTSLTAVTIPDSVTSIGNGAFEHCTSLTAVTIPDSVTSIDWEAFKDCASLTTMTIPDSVTSIGGRTFYGCTNLTTVTIPHSVTSIGWQAFNSCFSLESVTFNGTMAEWNAIEIADGNKFLTNAEIVCTDGIIPRPPLADGTCGENLTWVLDRNGTLTISGTGAMDDYQSSVFTPWQWYDFDIKSVLIEYGVTSIALVLLEVAQT